MGTFAFLFVIPALGIMAYNKGFKIAFPFHRIMCIDLEFKGALSNHQIQPAHFIDVANKG